MFDTLIGNEKVKEILKKAIQTNHILHSYLFIGQEGIGKKQFAREFANVLLDSKVEQQNHPDYDEIEPEEGKSIKIEQIRYLQQKIQEKPIISDKKVYLIHQAEMMTKEAQNCLLKTLEEPPAYAVIIVMTENESKILPTIKSRCTKIPFQNITEEELQQFAKQTWPEEEIPVSLLEACNGSIGKLLRVKENKQLYHELEEFLETVQKRDRLTAWKKAEIFSIQKEDIQDILDYLEILLYNKKEQKSFEAIVIVEETKKRLLANSNFDMCIDNLVIRMWDKIHEEYSRSSI